MWRSSALLLAVVAISGGRLAQGGPISYSVQASATGTLGLNSFTNALVTVTLTGDTGGVSGVLGGKSNHGTTTVTIAGLGTAIFTDTTRAYTDNLGPGGSARGGIADDSIGSSILTMVNPIFSTYDFVTPIGPVTSTAALGNDLTYNTDHGSFHMTSAASTGTFTATVPEPSSITLIGIGMALVAGYNRLRRR